MSSILSNLKSLFTADARSSKPGEGVAARAGAPKSPGKGTDVSGSSDDNFEMPSEVLESIVTDLESRPNAPTSQALTKPTSHAQKGAHESGDWLSLLGMRTPPSEADQTLKKLATMDNSTLSSMSPADLRALLHPLSTAQAFGKECLRVRACNPQVYAQCLFTKVLEDHKTATPQKMRQIIEKVLDLQAQSLTQADRIVCLAHVRSLSGTVTMKSADAYNGSVSKTSEVKLEGFTTIKALRFSMGALLQEAGILLHDRKPGSESTMIPPNRQRPEEMAHHLIAEASRLFAAREVAQRFENEPPNEYCKHVAESLRANGELLVPTGYLYSQGTPPKTVGHATYDYLRMVGDKVAIYRTNLGAGSDAHRSEHGKIEPAILEIDIKDAAAYLGDVLTAKHTIHDDQKKALAAFNKPLVERANAIQRDTLREIAESNRHKPQLVGNCTIENLIGSISMRHPKDVKYIKNIQRGYAQDFLAGIPDESNVRSQLSAANRRMIDSRLTELSRLPGVDLALKLPKFLLRNGAEGEEALDRVFSDSADGNQFGVGDAFITHALDSKKSLDEWRSILMYDKLSFSGKMGFCNLVESVVRFEQCAPTTEEILALLDDDDSTVPAKSEKPVIEHDERRKRRDDWMAEAKRLRVLVEQEKNASALESALRDLDLADVSDGESLGAKGPDHA